MYKARYEEIIKKIKEEKNISEEEIQSRINSKIKQLNELISRDGAAYIVANELGVKIFDLSKRRFKVNELMIGMTSMELTVKIVQKYDTIEYKKENRQGKVQSLLVGDETGAIRLVIWDDSQINSIQNTKEGEILLVRNGYVRENNGFKELHLNKLSSILLNPENEKIGDVLINIQRKTERKKIKDLKAGENTSIIGTIVQLFEPRFYSACPKCNRKLTQEEEKFRCNEHGIVNENINPILNFFLDDGSENIRVVAFRENVSNILGITNEDVIKMRDDLSKFMELRDNVLGSQIIINGRATKNEMFDRIEFMTNSISQINIKELANELLSRLK